MLSLSQSMCLGLSLKSSSVGDPYASNTILLANFATDATDDKGHTATLLGNAAVSGGAAVFDGVGVSIQYAGFDPTLFGTNNFTVEIVVIPNNGGANKSFFNTGGGAVWGSNMLSFGLQPPPAKGVYVSIYGVGAPTLNFAAGAPNLHDGSAHHVVIQRVSGVLTAYLDGFYATSTDGTASAITGATNGGVACIGETIDNEYFHGSINAIRVTAGVARYSGTNTAAANFTPVLTNF